LLNKFLQNAEVLRNQNEFGTNCAVDKHTKISVEICISADIQKVKYRPITRAQPGGAKGAEGLPLGRSKLRIKVRSFNF